LKVSTEMSATSTAKLETKIESIAQKIDALASQSLALRGESNNSQDFSGISWGIGVGSSYLGEENITNAVIVGSQTRVLEKNR